MSTGRLVGYLGGLSIATVGAVCMPMVVLGPPHIYIYPTLLVVAILFLVIWVVLGSKKANP